MGTVNAATLPRQRTNTFLTQHIVCQAAFNTTYDHNSHSGKTGAVWLNNGTDISCSGWLYKQTQRVDRHHADRSEPQHMEKSS
jgi:hypothetical protein